MKNLRYATPVLVIYQGKNAGTGYEGVITDTMNYHDTKNIDAYTIEVFRDGVSTGMKRFCVPHEIVYAKGDIDSLTKLAFYAGYGVVQSLKSHFAMCVESPSSTLGYHDAITILQASFNASILEQLEKEVLH